MPEIIADTSVIQYLYQCDCLSDLPALYGNIKIPSAVWDELEIRSNNRCCTANVHDYDWIQVIRLQPHALIPPITGLGLGEREVISMAIDSPESLALLDDGLARQHAKSLGIKVTGTLGILLKAKQSGLIDQVAPVLEQLNNLGFRISNSTQLTVLKLAGEATPPISS